MHITEYKNRIMSSRSQSELFNHTKDYLVSHCYKPRRLNIYDTYTNQYREMLVDCGCCYHCLSRKTNEWVTRLYAHAEDFKNVYFVTLTYNSIYKLNNVGRFYLDYFKDALFHYDNLNSTRRYCWRPCILVKKHYQDFLKRLRKNTGLTDLTYFVCGEYGHDHGAPHFHFIFFTNGVLTHRDIKSAWSAKVYLSDDGKVYPAKNHSSNLHTLSFGKTDLHDLIASGNFDTGNAPFSSLLDSKNNAYKCFAYVCKYLNKLEFNDSRVKLAFNSFKFDPVNELLGRFGDSALINNKIHYDIESFTHTSYNVSVIDPYFYKNNLIIQDYYDSVSCLLGKSNLPLIGDSEDFFDLFKRSMSPFTSMSRGTAIGSLYFKSHLKDILQGKIDCPALQEQGFIAPRYFIRKAQEYVYGFRRFSEKTKNPSFTKQNVRSFSEDFLAILNNQDAKSLSAVPDRFSQNFDVFHSKYCYKDVSTGERILFRWFVVEDCPLLYACHYLYDRHTRTYVLQRTTSIKEFCSYWLERFKRSYKQHMEQIEICEANKCQLDLTFDYIDEFLTSKCSGYEYILADTYKDLDDLDSYLNNRLHLDVRPYKSLFYQAHKLINDQNVHYKREYYLNRINLD